MSASPYHPILSCDEAHDFEEKLFGRDEAAEWSAMSLAGLRVGEGILRDFMEIGGFPVECRILIVAGKGHNGGDALLAGKTILDKYPKATAEILLPYGVQKTRPLSLRAFQEICHAHPKRTTNMREISGCYGLCIDGLFGFRFRPPLDSQSSEVLAKINVAPIRFRAAVDLPSGLGEVNAFQSDFTYATGIVKEPVIRAKIADVGRVRYLDLGFFDDVKVHEKSGSIVTPSVLDSLRKLRSPVSDKRTYGHLFVIGGSRHTPGAVLMTVRAALSSGAGLVTAFVPETIATAFAGIAPEAMWVPFPETPGGGLALEGLHLIRAQISPATALVLGPGVGQDSETHALLTELLKMSRVPAVVDADALQPAILASALCPLILTPHAGEFKRLSNAEPSNDALMQYAEAHLSTVVLKGPLSRIGSGKQIYYSPYGGPVLARGGSGDMLAGIIGTLLAQSPNDRLWAACAGTVWHGLAAEALAHSHGQVAVRATQLLDYLGTVLREQERLSNA